MGFGFGVYSLRLGFRVEGGEKRMTDVSLLASRHLDQTLARYRHHAPLHKFLHHGLREEGGKRGEEGARVGGVGGKGLGVME